MMKKIRLTSFIPAQKEDADDRIKNLERYIVLLQREIEHIINSLSEKEE